MRYNEIIRRLLGLVLVAAVCLISLSPRVESDRAGETYLAASHVVESTETQPVQISKTETVYVNLSADGSTQLVSVTDHLHSDLPQVRIEDASDLTQIQDVKTNLYPVSGTDRIYWDLDGTDLYYSGHSFNDPPVQFNVTYTLDGAAIAPENLAGQSGHVTMTISAENTLKKDAGGYTVSCPILLVGGMLLPEDGFENVEVIGGSMLGDGAHRIILLTGVPGMADSLGTEALNLPFLSGAMADTTYMISADVENFALGNMMFAAVPFSSLEAFSSGDLSAGLAGVKQVFSDIETVMNAFSSMQIQELIQMLYGDMEQAQSLISAVGEAALLYQENEALIQTLAGYATEENIAQMHKLLTDLEQIDMVRLEALLSCDLFQQLVNLISLIDQEVRDVVTVAEDAVAIQPSLDALKTDLDTPEAQAAMDRLPETAERLRALLQTLEDNRGLFDDLGKIQDPSVTNGLQTILGVTQKYAQLDSLNAARQNNLAGRLRAWLDFGEEYDIFTQRTDTMTSSVSFVYKLASIG